MAKAIAHRAISQSDLHKYALDLPDARERARAERCQSEGRRRSIVPRSSLRDPAAQALRVPLNREGAPPGTLLAPREGVPQAPVERLDPGDPLERVRLLAGACVVTDASRCVQCGTCSYNCPLGIDVRAHARAGQPVVDRRCLTCGECVRRCPRDALSFAGDWRAS